MDVRHCPVCGALSEGTRGNPVTETLIVDLGELLVRQIRTERKIDLILVKENIIMSQQADIDAAVQAEGDLLADLTAQTSAMSDGLDKLEAEIAALQAQGVDTTALANATAALRAAQAPLDAQVARLTSDANPAALAPPAEGDSGTDAGAPADGSTGDEAPADDDAAA